MAKRFNAHPLARLAFGPKKPMSTPTAAEIASAKAAFKAKGGIVTKLPDGPQAREAWLYFTFGIGLKEFS